MALAARLNLRMQKEIKLLLDDPPHGVSVDENVLSSLSSIEARIEGPDETVYAKGVFILKIQIPDRYPFQPPNVTFVTPIYHPNIDNGGRICLDILNLPPKGAWQPSLNIATVLTSIGLLLSEPNPDDGLMAEISREYKYNRQVFDINARLWTEKYASPAAVGASSWGSVDAGVLAQNTQMEDTETLGSLPNASKKDHEGNQRKLRLLGQKLSLNSERSEENMKTVKQDPVASHLPMAGSTYPTGCFSDVSGRQNDTSLNMSVSTASGVVSKKEYQGNINNLQLPGQRLSVTSEATSKRSDVNDTLPNHLPASASDANDHSMRSSDDILESSLARSIGGSSDISYKPPEGNRRKIRRLGLKLPLGSFKPEMKNDVQKENMAPNHLSSQPGFNNLQKRPLDAVKPEKTSDEQKENMASSHLPSQPGFNNSQKLPLDAVKPEKKSDEQKENMASNHLASQLGFNNSQKRPLDAVKPPKKSDEQKENMASNHLASQSGFNSLQKRPLDFVKPAKKSDEQKENMASNHLPSKSGFNNLQKRPLDAVSRKKFSGGPALAQQNPITEHQLSNTKMLPNEECNQGRKKLCSLSRRLSLKTELLRVDTACDKEDKPPNCSLSDKKPNELPSSAAPAPAPVPKGEAVVPNELPLVAPAVLKSQTPAIGFAGGQKDTNTGNSSVKQNTVAMENVVVADSESEDESERPQRSRLSLMRRRLAGKLRT